MKRTMLYAVLGLLIVGLPHAASASQDRPVTLLVDGKALPTSPPAVLRAGRVYVPVTVFRPIGLAVRVESSRAVEVGWPESDNIIDFRAGVGYYTWDAPEPVRVKLPGIPFMRGGVLMVPLKAFLSDRDYGTSLTAEWNPRSRTISLRRSRGWLRWRYQDDDAYVENSPDEYSHLFLGDYVPVIPSWEIERAEKLDASGDRQGAARVLRSLIESRPFTWNLEPGRVRDEWKAYEPLGRILLREHPESADGHFYLGIGLATRSEYAAAEQEFRLAAGIDPSSADAHFAAGWAVMCRERARHALDRDLEALRKALADYDRALEADPNHQLALRASGWAWYALAQTELQQGEYSDLSKARARPYLTNAIDRFERLLRAGGESPGLRQLIRQISDQLE